MTRNEGNHPLYQEDIRIGLWLLGGGLTTSEKASTSKNMLRQGHHATNIQSHQSHQPASHLALLLVSTTVINSGTVSRKCHHVLLGKNSVQH